MQDKPICRPLRWAGSVWFVRAALALSLSACAGAEATDGIEGTLVTRVASLEDGTTRAFEFLSTDHTDFELAGSARGAFKAGSKVRVHGTLSPGIFGQRLDVSDMELAPKHPAESVAEARSALIESKTPRQQKLGVIMVYWTTPDGNTPELLRSKLFTAENSTRAYYEEVSFGSHHLDGDVHGWYPIATPDGCNTREIANSATLAAEAQGVDLKQYDQVLYYFPSGACDFAGLGAIGSSEATARETWYSGSTGCIVLAQELGHNYGLMHSRACSEFDTTATCSKFSEYGDPFCPMGGGCFHMNAVQKAQMGWLDKCNVVTATSDGTFDIRALETPSNNLQALRIPRGNGRYLYVESRVVAGKFDTLRPTGSALNSVYEGVLIHDAGEVQPMPPSADDRFPYLIDAAPDDAQFQNSALAVGKTYTSPEGIVIKLVSKNDTARVQVTIPGGSGDATCLGGHKFDKDRDYSQNPLEEATDALRTNEASSAEARASGASVNGPGTDEPSGDPSSSATPEGKVQTGAPYGCTCKVAGDASNDSSRQLASAALALAALAVARRRMRG
jgi:M6 family metalloprotease-like protein